MADTCLAAFTIRLGEPTELREVPPESGEVLVRVDAADRVAWVRERTNGLVADIVIKATGSAAIPERLEMARHGGHHYR